jgi:hypothetical protein
MLRNIVLLILFLTACSADNMETEIPGSDVIKTDIKPKIAETDVETDITETKVAEMEVAQGDFDESFYSCLKNCKEWDLPSKVEVTTSIETVKEDYCTNLCTGEYYYRETANATSIESCLIIDHKEIRMRCENKLLYNLAIKSQNISLCESIHDETQVGNCRKKIIIDKAIEQNNIRVCDEWAGWEECKDVARMELAFLGDDMSLCEEIENEDKRNSCLDVIIPELVEKGQDVGLCNKLSDKSLLDSCMSLSYLNLDVTSFPHKDWSDDVDKQIIRPTTGRGVAPGPGN